MREQRTADRFSAAVTVLLAVLLIVQLLVPPIVGLADQGDYGRLWMPFGISSDLADPDRRFYRYLIRQWRIDADAAVTSGFVSADMLFVAASIPLNTWFLDAGTYDLRTLAAVRLVVALLGAFLLLRVAAVGGRGVQVVVALALLLLFADVGYVAYFNSGYTEPGSMLFGLLTIAFFARLAAGEGHRALNLAAFVACSALVVWSKPQNVLLAIPLALLTLRLSMLDARMGWRVAALAGGIAIVASAIAYREYPPPLWYKQHIRHIAVFNSLLPASPDPAADLRALGVEPTLATLSGKFPWDEEAKRRAGELQHGFHERVDDGAIARFYLRNPGRILPLLKLSASQALSVQLGVGHYEFESGRGAFAPANGYSPRSEFVKRFGPHRFRWVVAFLALAVVAAGFGWWTARTAGQRLAAEGVLLLALAAALQYATVAVLQGPQGVAKGMLFFAFLYDATIVSAIALAVHRWTFAKEAGRVVVRPE